MRPQSSPTWLIPTLCSPLLPPTSASQGGHRRCSSLQHPGQAALAGCSSPVLPTRKAPQSQRGLLLSLSLVQRGQRGAQANHSPFLQLPRCLHGAGRLPDQCVPLLMGPGQGLALLLFCHPWGDRRVRQPAAAGAACRAQPVRGLTARMRNQERALMQVALCGLMLLSPGLPPVPSPRASVPLFSDTCTLTNLQPQELLGSRCSF